MLQKIKNLKTKLSAKIQQRKREISYRNRKRLDVSPFSLRRYEQCLAYLTGEKHVEWRPFGSLALKPKLINVTARHDVDTLGCIQGLEAMLAIDQRWGVKSGVYFRVDAEDYRLEEHRDLVLKVQSQGFVVGLHTSAYTSDDYMEKFQRDTAQFVQATGIEPTSFTVHGLGQHRLVERELFSKEIVHQMQQWGYDFTDCNPFWYHYDYVIEDCHMDFTTKKRYIYRDFVELPSILRKNQRCLVLTHPCYWV